MAPPKNLLSFLLVFYINVVSCSLTVMLCSLTEQGFTWLFAIGCETIRLKHATLSTKLPINADNTSWGVAWMKCKGAAFLQRSTNSDETFLRGLFEWSIAEPNGNILGQNQGRIQGGERGKLLWAPRCKGAPHDEIYLFPIQYSFENFVIQKRYKNTTLHYIPMLRYVSRAPTATDFSASLAVWQF